MPGDDLTHGPPANKKHHRFSRINRHSLREWFYGLYAFSPVCRAF
jgi:hypothetical protein